MVMKHSGLVWNPFRRSYKANRMNILIGKLSQIRYASRVISWCRKFYAKQCPDALSHSRCGYLNVITFQMNKHVTEDSGNSILRRTNSPFTACKFCERSSVRLYFNCPFLFHCVFLNRLRFSIHRRLFGWRKSILLLG